MGLLESGTLIDGALTFGILINGALTRRRYRNQGGFAVEVQ